MMQVKYIKCYKLGPVIRNKLSLTVSRIGFTNGDGSILIKVQLSKKLLQSDYPLILEQTAVLYNTHYL